MLTRLKRKMRLIFPSAVKISGGDEPRVRNRMGTVCYKPRIRNWMSTIGYKPRIWNWMSSVGYQPRIWNWMSSVGYQPRIWNRVSTIGYQPWIWNRVNSIGGEPRCRAKLCTVCIRDVGAKSGACEQECEREQNSKLN
jgi:hypothetical protein